MYLGYQSFLYDYMHASGTDRISPQCVRSMLLGIGIDLKEKTIEHIIPRSMGGLDHPRNYCIVSDELSRAWAEDWSDDKRAILGNRIVHSACDWAAQQHPSNTTRGGVVASDCGETARSTT